MSLLRSQGRALAGLLLSTLLTTGCEPPPVVPTTDRHQQTQAARIEGSIVVQGPARGNAVVFLYDTERPPPPQGTGRPVAFTLIPQEELFGSDLGNNTTGPFTAPFVFPLVRKGSYLLRGFIDVDTCRTGPQPCHGPDFIPWYNVTAEPNLGDVAGAAVDLSSPARPLRIIEVKETEDGTPIPVMGVTVSFSDTATLTADRPAFEVLPFASPTIDPNGSVKLFKLRARPIRQDAVNLSAPIFLVRLADENRDGQPDDANRDGVWDLWPRVIVRKLADEGPGLTDENDLDNNGILDAQGMDYLRADGGVTDGLPDLTVLAAGIVPDPFLGMLRDSEGKPLMNAVIPTPELTLGVRPLAFDARNAASPVALKTMPSGRYAVIVIQSTGQVWRVPNELMPNVAEERGLPPVDSQGFFLTVP